MKQIALITTGILLFVFTGLNAQYNFALGLRTGGTTGYYA